MLHVVIVSTMCFKDSARGCRYSQCKSVCLSANMPAAQLQYKQYIIKHCALVITETSDFSQL